MGNSWPHGLCFVFFVVVVFFVCLFVFVFLFFFCFFVFLGGGGWMGSNASVDTSRSFYRRRSDTLTYCHTKTTESSHL